MQDHSDRGEDAMASLKEQARDGLRRRLGQMEARLDQNGREVYERRLEGELALIADRGLAAWFLRFVKKIDAMRAEGMPWAPGWGAAPSSLVLFALGATDIDPVRHGLVFERFIGPPADVEPYVPFIVPNAVAVRQALATAREVASGQVTDDDVFDELVATLSLQRPAPEASGLAAEYARRRGGPRRSAFPELERVTAETRGLVLYDEQVILAVAEWTGWSRSEAEAARREMVRPRETLPVLRQRFIQDAVGPGHGAEGSERLFNHLAEVARTAIQKSHHVALATVACRPV